MALTDFNVRDNLVRIIYVDRLRRVFSNPNTALTPQDAAPLLRQGLIRPQGSYAPNMPVQYEITQVGKEAIIWYLARHGCERNI